MLFFFNDFIDQGSALKTGYKKVAAELPSNLVQSYSYLILYKRQLFCKDCYRSKFRFKTGYTKRVAAQLQSNLV